MNDSVTILASEVSSILEIILKNPNNCIMLSHPVMVNNGTE